MINVKIIANNLNYNIVICIEIGVKEQIWCHAQPMRYSYKKQMIANNNRKDGFKRVI